MQNLGTENENIKRKLNDYENLHFKILKDDNDVLSKRNMDIV